LRHFYPKKGIISPRQARDKHRESTQNRDVFSYRRAAEQADRRAVDNDNDNDDDDDDDDNHANNIATAY
jgi:hypothetical protein